MSTAFHFPGPPARSGHRRILVTDTDAFLFLPQAERSIDLRVDFNVSTVIERAQVFTAIERDPVFTATERDPVFTVIERISYR